MTFDNSLSAAVAGVGLCADLLALGLFVALMFTGYQFRSWDWAIVIGLAAGLYTNLGYVMKWML